MADDGKNKPVKEIKELKPNHPVDPALEEARRRHDEAGKGYPPGRITVDLTKPSGQTVERKEEPKKPTEIKKPEPKKEEAKKEPEGRGGK